MDRKLNEIDTRATRIEDTIPQYEAWIGLDIPVDKIGDTRTSKVLVGSVETSRGQAFEQAVESDLDLMYVENVGSSRDSTNYLVIYHRSVQDEAESVLREFGFINATFSGVEGTPKKIINSLNAELTSMQEERENILKRVGELASDVGELELFYDALSTELR